MEARADFHDWEILLGPDPDPDPVVELKPLRAPSEVDSEDGAIKFGYFALDPMNLHRKGAASGGVSHGEDVQVDSDIPSWVDPESNSQFVDRCEEQMLLPGAEFPRDDLAGFWSDDSSEGQRSHFCSEKARADIDEGDEKEAGIEEIEVIQEKRMGNDKSDEEDTHDHVKMKNISSAEMNKIMCSEMGVSNNGGERRGMVWWKFPFEILKLCILRAKPIWPISVAAAVLGVLMLGKRLYGMKQKTTSIPLKVILDEKKASQLKIHAARLTEAFSVVRRAPIIRASLPAGGLTPWSVVSLQ